MAAYVTSPFLPFGAPVASALTTASTNNELARAKDQVLLVTNAGGNGTLFVRLSTTSTMSASSADCVPVTAGSQRLFSVLEAHTHIAMALSSGTGNAWVNCGDGAIF
jgi:hypothetical protein